MDQKWMIRIGVLIVFCFIMYYGYQAKKSYEKSLEPHVEQYYDGLQPEGFIFDIHAHAYRDADDGTTKYLDDPKLHNNTVIPYRADYTPPPPLTVDQLEKNKRKRAARDEFPIKGKVTRDEDRRGSAYSDQDGAYDGILPGDDEVYY